MHELFHFNDNTDFIHGAASFDTTKQIGAWVTSQCHVLSGHIESGPDQEQMERFQSTLTGVLATLPYWSPPPDYLGVSEYPGLFVHWVDYNSMLSVRVAVVLDNSPTATFGYLSPAESYSVKFRSVIRSYPLEFLDQFQVLGDDIMVVRGAQGDICH